MGGSYDAQFTTRARNNLTVAPCPSCATVSLNIGSILAPFRHWKPMLAAS
jgi:hypothetical protein